MSAPGLSGNVIATPTITGCGSTTVTPLDAAGNGTSQLNTYVAMNLPNTCTGVSASSSLGGTSNRWSIATVVLRGLPTSYIVENYTHNPTASVLSLTMNTLEASSLLVSTTVDNNGASSFTPSAGFTTLLTQSAYSPGMMVSTDSGGPAAYTSNPTGCLSNCWQSLVVIRSVLPAFGVMQFSHVNSGTGTSLTCTLPFPSTAGDGLIGTAIPFGSSDTCAVPHDDQSNAYKQIGSLLPTSNGAGCMFYAKNITASSSPVITFPTLNGGSATTFTTRCAETRGASPVAPYSASTQSYQKNYPITTNFQFGPVTLPVGNYLMIGEGYVGTENYPFTVTNGTQLGNFEDPTHGLTNFFLAPFSSSGAPYTMTVTPSSGQPATWFSGIFTDTADYYAKITQSTFCSYGCTGGGPLVTPYVVAAGDTGVVFMANTSSALPVMTASPADTFTQDCSFTASQAYMLWHGSNLTGGSQYSFSFTNITDSGVHFAELNNVGAFDGAACNGGPNTTPGTTSYNSGNITITHTDMVLSCGSFAGAFGDQPVNQDGTWPQSFTSQYSDYIGAQCSMQILPPGTYHSANYSAPTNTGTLGAAVIAFQISPFPATQTTLQGVSAQGVSVQ